MKKATLEQRLIFRLPVLSRLSNDRLAKIYKPVFELSVSEWHTMSIIGRYTPISPKKISQISTMSAFNVSRNISKLEDKEWVFRHICKQDKRQIELTLTKVGEGVYEKIEAIAQRLEENLVEVLTDSEREDLDKILDKLELRFREVI